MCTAASRGNRGIVSFTSDVTFTAIHCYQVTHCSPRSLKLKVKATQFFTASQDKWIFSNAATRTSDIFLHSIWFDSSWFYSTRLDSTRLESTRLDSYKMTHMYRNPMGVGGGGGGKPFCFCGTLMSQVQLYETDLDSARVRSAVNRQPVFICYLLLLRGTNSQGCRHTCLLPDNVLSNWNTNRIYTVSFLNIKQHA
jgi:hypothetical protein